MYINKGLEDFLKWCKTKGKLRKEIQDVFINDNGEYKVEKREVDVLKGSLEIIEEYEQDTGLKLPLESIIIFGKKQ